MLLPCSFFLSSSAGADKKAEAGAGAATEFQFVSIDFSFKTWICVSIVNTTVTQHFFVDFLLACGCGFRFPLHKNCQVNLNRCSLNFHRTQVNWCFDNLLVTEGWLWTRQRTAATVNFHSHFLYNKENQKTAKTVYFFFFLNNGDHHAIKFSVKQFYKLNLISKLEKKQSASLGWEAQEGIDLMSKTKLNGGSDQWTGLVSCSVKVSQWVGMHIKPKIKLVTIIFTHALH